MQSTFIFVNDTATTEVYTLSLHDALPISRAQTTSAFASPAAAIARSMNAHFRPTLSTRNTRASGSAAASARPGNPRSEEHTSELQSRQYLVCRLLLEKTKNDNNTFALMSR